MQTPEHITFRPGELAERLVRGPLSPGGIAKRDLIRYYALVEDIADRWSAAWTMTTEAWDVIIDFAATRGWEEIPPEHAVEAQFKAFLTSPLGQRHDRVSRSMAATALLNADYPQVVSIIHLAETGARLRDLRAAARAGATSAAASGQPAG